MTDKELYKEGVKEVDSRLKTKHKAAPRKNTPEPLNYRQWKSKQHRFKYEERSGVIARRKKYSRKDAKVYDYHAKRTFAGVAGMMAGGAALAYGGYVGPVTGMLKTAKVQNKVMLGGGVLTVAGLVYGNRHASKGLQIQRKYPYKGVDKFHSPALAEYKERNRIPAWAEAQAGSAKINSSYYYRRQGGKQVRVKKGRRRARR